MSRSLTWCVDHGLSWGLCRLTRLLSLQLEHPKLKSQGLNLDGIKAIVKADSKQRYDLILEGSDGMKLGAVSPGEKSILLEMGSVSFPVNSSGEKVVEGSSSGEITNDKDAIWLIKARQGHSIKVFPAPKI